VSESGTGSKRVELSGGSGGNDAYVYLDVAQREMADFMAVATTHMPDAGSGRGGFGGSAKVRAELKVTGVELDQQARAEAASGYEHVTTRTCLDDVSSGAEYACIAFNYILDHFVDPWEALRAALIWPLLTRGKWRHVSDAVLDRTHLRFFTLASAKEIFTDSGFIIERATPINLAGFDQLQPRSTPVLKARGPLVQELRAQQFAIVVTPRPRSEH
jgi:hypothetical protein